MTKRIIRTKSSIGVFINGYIFGNYGCSVNDYNLLIQEAKKDFPFLTDDDIRLDKVSKSTYMKGFIFVQFRLREEDIKEGYDIWNWIDFETI